MNVRISKRGCAGAPALVRPVLVRPVLVRLVLVLLVLVLLVLALLSACGGGAADPPAASDASLPDVTRDAGTDAATQDAARDGGGGAVDAGAPLPLTWWEGTEDPEARQRFDILAQLWGGAGLGLFEVDAELETLFEGDGFTVIGGHVLATPVPPAAAAFARREGALVSQTGSDGCRLDTDASALTVNGFGVDYATRQRRMSARSHTFAGFALETEFQALLDRSPPVIEPDRMKALCQGRTEPFLDARILSIADDWSREALQQGAAGRPERVSQLLTSTFYADVASVGCCADGTIRVGDRAAQGVVIEADLEANTGGASECWWFEPSGGGMCTGACPAAACHEGFCGDEVDNDRDGATDCGDPDCDGASCGDACVCGGAEVCGDGQDNSGDGQIDCADSACDAQPCGDGCQCQSDLPVETACADGRDNDGDGQADCADSDCAGQPCGGGGRVCSGGACACAGGNLERTCDDGADNDCDGLVDCADPDCAELPCGSEQPCAIPVCRSGSCALDIELKEGSPCDDGDRCTVPDHCSEGICLPGTPQDCPGGATCRPQRCEPTTGDCVQATDPDGTACDDGDLCTTGETCQDGHCGGVLPDDVVPCCYDQGFRCEGLSAGGSCAAACLAAGGTPGTSPGGADLCQPGACACQPDPREPDDTPAQAPPLLLDANRRGSATGTVCDTQQGDWFALTVGAGDQIQVTITAAAGTGATLPEPGVFASLLFPNEAIVEIPRAEGASATWRLPPAGATPPAAGFVWADALGFRYDVVRLLVAPSAPAPVPFRYALDVEVLPCIDDDHEPNQRARDAVPLAAGVEHVDLMICGNDDDWYTVGDVEDGARVEMQAPSQESLVGQGLSLTWQLVDDQGLPLDTGRLAPGATARFTNTTGHTLAGVRVGVTIDESAGDGGNLRYRFRYDVVPRECYQEPWQREGGAKAARAAADPTQCASEGVCGDAIDNDGNGLADCADPQCAGRACDPSGRACDESGVCACPGGATIEETCDDGLDDDCDGLVDCDDPDCPRVWCCTDGGIAHENVACAAECVAMGGTVAEADCGPTTCGFREAFCACPEDGYEANDTYATATPFPLSGDAGSVDGVLCPGTGGGYGSDYFSTSMGVGDRFEATVTVTGGTAPYSSPLGWATTTRPNGESGLFEEIGPGQWRVNPTPLTKVNHLAGAHQAEVAITVYGNARFAYRLDLVITRCPDDGYEPNDTREGAAALPKGALQEGLQVCQDDQDWFALEDLPPGEQVVVDLYYDPTDNGGQMAWNIHVTAVEMGGITIFTTGSSPSSAADGHIHVAARNNGSVPLTGVRLAVSPSYSGTFNPIYALEYDIVPAP